MSTSEDALTRGAALAEGARLVGRLDARLLLEAAAGCTHGDLLSHPEIPLSGEASARYRGWLARRAAGEPLAYLLGSAPFCGMGLEVGPGVLVPRPETELLVEQVLAKLQTLDAQTQAGGVVDLGTGSGAIALAVARARPDLPVLAVDASPAALVIARRNADKLLGAGARLSLRESDWFAAVPERFAVVASNPPYIAAGDPHLQGDGLRFEPASALTDGADGLRCLDHLITTAPRHLLPQGWLLLEHGYDQGEAVRQCLTATGFHGVQTWRDFAHIERVSGGYWPG